MGIPPTRADATFASPHDRQTREGVTTDARGPKYSWDRSVTATTALPKVSGSCGTTKRKNAANRALGPGIPNPGRWNEGLPTPGWPTTMPAVTPATRIASATTYLRRAAAHITPASAPAARMTGHGEAGVPRNTEGGLRTSFSAEMTRRIPTPSWRARTTVLVNRRAITSPTRLVDSSSEQAPVSKAPAGSMPGAAAHAP